MLASNSSTLILIAKITLLPRFLEAVKNISITNIVYQEITVKDSFENLAVRREVDKGRIKVEAVNEKFYTGIIKQFKLDEGEASVFALCKNKKYKAVLTDDKELIKVCKIEDIKFISAMAVVIILLKKKIISKNEALEKLEKLQGYGRYSNEIYNYVKNHQLETDGMQ